MSIYTSSNPNMLQKSLSLAFSSFLGIIPVLEQLLEQSRSTEFAYLCHPRVQHVTKLKQEGMYGADTVFMTYLVLTAFLLGGFCGYRNIQMLISHIIGAQAVGSDLFASRYPSILQIQDLIENAWDLGFNSHGRIETGGIKGTRKYIGTPEVCVIRAMTEQATDKVSHRPGPGVVLQLDNTVSAISYCITWYD